MLQSSATRAKRRSTGASLKAHPCLIMSWHLLRTAKPPSTLLFCAGMHHHHHVLVVSTKHHHHRGHHHTVLIGTRSDKTSGPLGLSRVSGGFGVWGCAHALATNSVISDSYTKLSCSGTTCCKYMHDHQNHKRNHPFFAEHLPGTGILVHCILEVYHRRMMLTFSRSKSSSLRLAGLREPPL